VAISADLAFRPTPREGHTEFATHDSPHLRQALHLTGLIRAMAMRRVGAP
jgi:hypothetical protein